MAGDNTGAVIVDNVATGNATGEASVAGNSTDNVVTVEAGTAGGKAGAGSADNIVAENTEDGEKADRENAEPDNVNSAVAVDASQTSYEVIEKIGPEGMDEALNIRLSIYAAYLRNLNWFGHPDAEGLSVCGYRLFFLACAECMASNGILLWDSFGHPVSDTYSAAFQEKLWNSEKLREMYPIR